MVGAADIEILSLPGMQFSSYGWMESCWDWWYRFLKGRKSQPGQMPKMWSNLEVVSVAELATRADSLTLTAQRRNRWARKT